MKNILYYYDIFPKVVKAGRVSKITVRPIGRQSRLREDGSYTLVINPINEGRASCYPNRRNNFSYAVEVDSLGGFSFEFDFFAEQEYYIRVYEEGKQNSLLDLSVYAVAEDMWGRIPLKGDLHMHTSCSDGRQAPEIVVANYRQFGYDFMTISDHNRYYPSLEVIDFYKNVPIDLCIVPGEEVHLPKIGEYINDIHIVNFGGEYSINALVEHIATEEKGKELKYRAIRTEDVPEVMTKQEWLDSVLEFTDKLDIPEGIERFSYGCCCWIFEQIRRAKGLGIFAHPCWILDKSFQVPDSLFDYLMETQPFDAFEVIGGEAYFEQNGFQIAKYYDDRARGRIYPIVGSTDSHSSLPDNRIGRACSTIVFSKNNERTAIISAIKEMYSVAVDTYDENYRLIGEPRLLRYACFLMENYFPLHDELCFEEGRAMRAYACFEEEGEKTLELLHGRVEAMIRKYFAI